MIQDVLRVYRLAQALGIYGISERGHVSKGGWTILPTVEGKALIAPLPL